MISVLVFVDVYGRSQAWARGGGHSPSGNVQCCSVLCISSYSKALSRRIIYALFLQPVVGFAPSRAPGAPSLDSAGGLLSPDPKLPTSGKNPAGAHVGVVAATVAFVMVLSSTLHLSTSCNISIGLYMSYSNVY